MRLAEIIVYGGIATTFFLIIALAVNIPNPTTTTASNPVTTQIRIETHDRFAPIETINRFVDNETGAICYLRASNSISCVR